MKRSESINQSSELAETVVPERRHRLGRRLAAVVAGGGLTLAALAGCGTTSAEKSLGSTTPATAAPGKTPPKPNTTIRSHQAPSSTAAPEQQPANGSNINPDLCQVISLSQIANIVGVISPANPDAESPSSPEAIVDKCYPFGQLTGSGFEAYFADNAISGAAWGGGDVAGSLEVNVVSQIVPNEGKNGLIGITTQPVDAVAGHSAYEQMNNTPTGLPELHIVLNSQQIEIVSIANSGANFNQTLGEGEERAVAELIFQNGTSAS